MDRLDLEHYEKKPVNYIPRAIAGEGDPRYENPWTELDGPILFAALKKAYEEIDKLERALSIINNTHFPEE